MQNNRPNVSGVAFEKHPGGTLLALFTRIRKEKKVEEMSKGMGGALTINSTQQHQHFS